MELFVINKSGRTASLNSGLTLSNRAIVDALKSSDDHKKRGKSLMKKDRINDKVIDNSSHNSKKIFLIRSSNEDIEVAYKSVHESKADNLIISHLLENIGEDIVVLNEEKYIPSFEHMLNLMMPLEERKIKVSNLNYQTSAFK